jgi:hypothetical protein
LTPVRPRFFSEVRKVRQNTSSSLSPTSRPRNSRSPSARAGDHDGHRDHLGGAVAHVQVGGIEIDVGELDVVQPAGAEGGDHLVQAGADPGDPGLGDPRADAQGGDQVVDRAVETPHT